MKLFYSFLAGTLCLCSPSIRAAETANATLFCWSMQFQRGIDPNGNYFLNLTSLSGSLNGELAVDFFASPYTHSAYLSMEDELFGETLGGQLVLDIPAFQDVNKDSFNDFFQVSQGVTNRTSAGDCNLDIYGHSSVAATWNRDAGSSSGGCTLRLTLMGQPVTFSHSFQILEYRGPLTYVPGATNVTGALSLVQTDNPGATMSGDVAFEKSATDPFNALTLQAGTWTNESQQATSFVTEAFARDPKWPTNYYGNIEMTDPSNPTGFYPYGLWMLSIDDLNDSNHNSIPDFSDSPGSKPAPRAPQAELSLVGTNLVLNLHGDVGYLHEIQTLSDLATTNWQTALSITLTNDPQAVSLPLPTNGLSFWRVRAN
jgi:hypothetical protein